MIKTNADTTRASPISKLTSPEWVTRIFDNKNKSNKCNLSFGITKQNRRYPLDYSSMN